MLAMRTICLQTDVVDVKAADRSRTMRAIVGYGYENQRGAPL
jgi:hypothetical protein